MRTVQVNRLPTQREFFQCDADWAAAYGGVGSGKTTAVVWWLIQRMLKYPRANHYAVGADYGQLQRGIFGDSLIGFLEGTLGWERGIDFRYTSLPRPKLVLLPSEATLNSISAEIGARSASLQIQTVVCEEPQSWHEGESFFRYIIERSRHNPLTAKLYPDMKPQGRMTFNPPEVGSWLHNLVLVQWPKAGFPSWRFSLRDNTLLVGREAYIRDIELVTDPSRWPNRIDGFFSTAGGNVYRMFDRELMAKPVVGLALLAYDPAKPLLFTMDFNVHKMCAAVMQVESQKMISLGFDHSDTRKMPIERRRPEVDGWQRRVYSAIDEIVMRDRSSEDVAEEFVRRYARYKPYVYVYGDPAGGNREQSSLKTSWGAIRDVFDRAGLQYEFRIQRNHPAVLDRVNYANAVFRNVDGYGFRVDPNACPELCADFMGVKFKEGKNEVDKSDMERTHMSDAVSYALFVERALENGEKVEFKYDISR